MIEQSEFRRVIGHFASGVTVVTTLGDDGKPRGLTASAVCSVSLDPTLLLVCVERTADTYPALESSEIFAVNVLGLERGESLARRFADPGEADQFRGVAYHSVRTGAPVLQDSLAWLDCRLERMVPGGDHGIFIGEVVAADARDEGTPLLYYRGGYGAFRP